MKILFSEMDAAASIVAADVSCFEEKGGLPVEAFAKVHEIFSHVDWLDHGSDFALNVLQHISATNIIQEMSDTESPPSVGISSLLQELSPREHQDKKSQSELDDSPKTSPKDYRNMIINASNLIQEISDSDSPPSMIISSLLQELSPRGHQDKKNHIAEEDSTKSSLSSAVKTQSVPSPKMSLDTDESNANEEPQDSWNALQLPNQSDVISQKTSKSSQTTMLSCNSVQVSSLSVSGHHNASLAPCCKPVLHDHALSVSAEVTHQIPASPAVTNPNLASSCKHEAAALKSDSFSPTTPPTPRRSITFSASNVPPPPPLPQLLPHHFSSSCSAHFPHTKESKSHMQDIDKPSSATPLPAPETSSSGTNSSTTLSTTPLPAPATATSTLPPSPPPPPPPTPPLKTPVSDRITNASFSTPSPPASTVTSSTTSSPSTPLPPPMPPLKEQSAIKAGPPPPPPPPLYSGSGSSTVSSPATPPAPPPLSFSSNSSPVPPPPPIAKLVSKTGVASPVPAPPSLSPSSGKGRLSRTISSRSHQTKKLKPLHWLKLTRAVQGSLWAEAQKFGEASKCVLLRQKEHFCFFQINFL